MRAPPLGPSVEFLLGPRTVRGVYLNGEEGGGREEGEVRRGGEEERGAPSLQNEDPTPQDGWEKGRRSARPSTSGGRLPARLLARPLASASLTR